MRNRELALRYKNISLFPGQGHWETGGEPISARDAYQIEFADVIWEPVTSSNKHLYDLRISHDFLDGGDHLVVELLADYFAANPYHVYPQEGDTMNWASALASWNFVDLALEPFGLQLEEPGGRASETEIKIIKRILP